MAQTRSHSNSLLQRAVSFINLHLWEILPDEKVCCGSQFIIIPCIGTYWNCKFMKLMKSSIACKSSQCLCGPPQSIKGVGGRPPFSTCEIAAKLHILPAKLGAAPSNLIGPYPCIPLSLPFFKKTPSFKTVFFFYFKSLIKPILEKILNSIFQPCTSWILVKQ